MKQEEREFPRSLGADIQNSQIARFMAKWEKISPVQYVGERIGRLDMSGQEVIGDYLIMRGDAIGKAVVPSEQNVADNTCGNFMLGALFMDEIMNTIFQFNHRMDIRELENFDAFKNDYPKHEDSLMDVNRFISYVSPNLKILMDDILDKLPEDKKFVVATGLIEMYTLKIMRSDALRGLKIGLSIPDPFRKLIQDLDLEGI